MPAALFCHVDPVKAEERRRLRAAHLAYVAAHRHLIVAGGPTLDADGLPETMVLLLDLPDVAAAEAFIRDEPYAAGGVFSRIEARSWAQVMPEPSPGSLDAALAAERANG